MNTVQNSQEKRTIQVKAFLDDFRSGVPDEELIEKYRLTAAGLEKFVSMLNERGIVDDREIDERCALKSRAEESPPPDGESDNASFICPACLASHKDMFDICPHCGVSFQELIDQPKSEPQQPDTSDYFDAPPSSNQAFDEPVPEFSTVSVAETGAPTAVNAESKPKTAARSVDDFGDEFAGSTDQVAARSGFDEVMDEVVAGRPFDDYSHADPAAVAPVEPRCEGCGESMEPAVREIYDRQTSIHAFMGAGIMLAVGFLGALILSFFESQSAVRLIVFYLTAVAFLSGGVLSAVAAFLFLAREKVYLCSCCKRILPRA